MLLDFSAARRAAAWSAASVVAGAVPGATGAGVVAAVIAARTTLLRGVQHSVAEGEIFEGRAVQVGDRRHPLAAERGHRGLEPGGLVG